MSIRILIVDDHAVVRQGLRMFLGLDSDLEIIGEAVNGKQAVEMAKQLAPDVVLMLRMVSSRSSGAPRPHPETS